MLQQSRKRGLRGANYTHEEKSLLLDLVMQHKDIIECKRTDGKFIDKKREAWSDIALKYNSNCGSRPRDREQLKRLYDNLKQKSRKDLRMSNEFSYLDAEKDCTITVDDIARVIKKDDKDETIAAENDAKILSIIQDSNSAGSFIKETDVESDNNMIITPDPPLCLSSWDIKVKETDVESDNNMTITPDPPLCLSSWDIKVKVEESQASGNVLEIDPVPKISSNPKQCKVLNKKKAFKQRKKTKLTSAEALKRLYFKKKCQNADIERNKLLLEIIHVKREHNLKMEILRHKLFSAELNL